MLVSGLIHVTHGKVDGVFARERNVSSKFMSRGEILIELLVWAAPK